MVGYRPIWGQPPQLKILKVQMLYSTVTVSGMSHGQALYRNLEELPLQHSTLILLFKRGTTVNVACYESAQKAEP